MHWKRSEMVVFEQWSIIILRRSCEKSHSFSGSMSFSLTIFFTSQTSEAKSLSSFVNFLTVAFFNSTFTVSSSSNGSCSCVSSGDGEGVSTMIDVWHNVRRASVSSFILSSAVATLFQAALGFPLSHVSRTAGRFYSALTTWPLSVLLTCATYISIHQDTNIQWHTAEISIYKTEDSSIVETGYIWTGYRPN